MKHFWSAVAVDRPKKEKDLIDNIELYKPEGDFSDMEKIEYLTGLTGIFPFSLVLKNDVYDSIKKNKIPALGEYDKAMIEFHEALKGISGHVPTLNSLGVLYLMKKL